MTNNIRREVLEMNHAFYAALLAGNVSIGGKVISVNGSPTVPASATPRFAEGDKVVINQRSDTTPIRHFWMVSEVRYGNPVSYRLTSMAGDRLDWTSESYLEPYVYTVQSDEKFTEGDKVWHPTFVNTEYAFMTVVGIGHNGEGYVYTVMPPGGAIQNDDMPEAELHPWSEPDESARTLSLGDYVVLASDQMGDELPFTVTGCIWGGDEWFISINGLNPDMIYPQSGWKLASFTSPFKNDEPVQIIKPRDKFEAMGKPYQVCGSISPNTTRIKPWGSEDEGACYSIPTECLAEFPKPKFDGGDTVEFATENVHEGQFLVTLVQLSPGGIWRYDIQMINDNLAIDEWDHRTFSSVREADLKLAATDEFQFEVGDFVRIKASGERRNIAKDAGGDWWVLNGGKRYPSAQLELIDRPEFTPDFYSSQAQAELEQTLKDIEPTLFDPELVMTRKQRDGLMEVLYGPDSDPLDAEAHIGMLQELFPVVQNLSVKPE